nr:hypothetical protein [Candidatus Sigynarchaeota archaeon]
MQDRRLFSGSRFAFQVNAIAAFMLAGSLAYLFFVATMIWSFTQNRWGTVFPTCAGLFGVVVVVLIYALKQYSTVAGKITLIVLDLGLGVPIVVYYLLQEKSFCIPF